MLNIRLLLKLITLLALNFLAIVNYLIKVFYNYYYFNKILIKYLKFSIHLLLYYSN
jgi:hypothetical protein